MAGKTADKMRIKSIRIFIWLSAFCISYVCNFSIWLKLMPVYVLSYFLRLYLLINFQYVTQQSTYIVWYYYHWLPIEQQVDFKVGVTTYRCMHSTAPENLSDMFTSLSDNPCHCHLFSAVHGDIVIAWTYTKTRPTQFRCQETSQLERTPDCCLQHGPVTELFPPRTEDILLLQSLRMWSGTLVMVVYYKNVRTSNFFELNSIEP